MPARERKPRAGHTFRHWAVFYRGQQGFLDATLPFIRDGIQAGEPTLVMVSAQKIELLRGALEGEHEDVHYADMDWVGVNPARLIPAWRRFVDEHSGGERRLRGVGEPISASRTAPQLVECQRHEALLNLAFADAGDFELLCPYDSEALESEVMTEVKRSHPILVEDGRERPSDQYLGLEAIAEPFDVPLPDPPTCASEFSFDAATLVGLRTFIREYGHERDIGHEAVENLVTGVNELAANSVRHGGGRGTAKLWRDDGVLVCDIRDRGKLRAPLAPLAGRLKPPSRDLRGRGLWLANQICDLIQLRSAPDGTQARAHVAIA
jgi:anti-sigma regulatory factor (Ser/Thr protein kinase)